MQINHLGKQNESTNEKQESNKRRIDESMQINHLGKQNESTNEKQESNKRRIDENDANQSPWKTE
jgi:hypothetical protein